MKKEMRVETVVDSILEKITGAGEKFGFKIGLAGRTFEKILIGAAVVVIFGVAAFVWAIFKGMGKKK